MRHLILVCAVCALTACGNGSGSPDGATAPPVSDPGSPGVPALPEPFSSVGSSATVVIRNVAVGQIRRIAVGDGTPAIGSADLVLSCTITGTSEAVCGVISGVPQ